MMKIVTMVVLLLCTGGASNAQIIANFQEDQKAVFDRGDKYARSYGNALPNFILIQSTCVYVDKTGTAKKWKQTRCLEEEVTFHNGRDTYRLVSVNSKPVPPKDMASGSTTIIEYLALISCIFEQNSAMKSHPEIAWERSEAIGKQNLYVYSYRIPESRSALFMHRKRVGYHGLISIDSETGEVVRIENEWTPASKDPAFEASRTIIEYELVSIGDQRYMLPAKMHNYLQSGKRMIRKETILKEYRKFSVGAQVNFDTEPNQDN
jgi:hypothetical protein